MSYVYFLAIINILTIFLNLSLIFFKKEAFSFWLAEHESFLCGYLFLQVVKFTY